MLVLSRRVGEEIVIDGRIRVRVIELSGNRVRLAVEAPRSIQIDRQEVYARKATLLQAPSGEMGSLGLSATSGP